MLCKRVYQLFQLLRELKVLQDRYLKNQDGAFQAADKLEEYYRRAFEKGIADPEEYAVKTGLSGCRDFDQLCNFWITSNYREIMSGTYCHDLFYQTFGEKLMDLLGDLANRRYLPRRRFTGWR